MTVPTAEADALSPTALPRRSLRRLSVSELLAAVQAARGGRDINRIDDDPHRLAAGYPTAPETPTHRALATPSVVHAALPVTMDDPDADDTLDCWVPDHDDSVSLIDLAAPHRRPGTRRTPQPELRNAGAESPPRWRTTSGRKKSKPGGREQRALAALREMGATSIGVLSACGGSGATTVTAVLALALAKTTGHAMAIGSDATDTRWLAARCGVEGADLDQLSRWLRITGSEDITAGLDLSAATRTSDGQLLVVAATRPPGASGPTGLAGRDIPLALRHISSGPAVLDLGTPWSSSAAECLPSVTHFVLTAPRSTTGLVAAEYVIADLDERLPDPTRPLVLLLINTAGRAGRPGRAALARLAGLGVECLDLPSDRHAAAGTAISWSSLSAATRKATVALLTELLIRGDNR